MAWTGNSNGKIPTGARPEPGALRTSSPEFSYGNEGPSQRDVKKGSGTRAEAGAVWAQGVSEVCGPLSRLCLQVSQDTALPS